MGANLYLRSKAQIAERKFHSFCFYGFLSTSIIKVIAHTARIAPTMQPPKNPDCGFQKWNHGVVGGSVFGMAFLSPL
jgi:hypothetical protein